MPLTQNNSISSARALLQPRYIEAKLSELVPKLWGSRGELLISPKLGAELLSRLEIERKWRQSRIKQTISNAESIHEVVGGTAVIIIAESDANLTLAE